jgi:thiol-disulfide isomerase/thioredoxin
MAPSEPAAINNVVDTTSDSETPAEPANEVSSTPAEPGRFVDYEASQVAAAGYNETILFFYAPWCPECRAFEQAINDTGVPEGVQILSVDYDSSDELKMKYGVTIQTTFVKVDANGSLVSRWVGYGQDRSVDVILENT